MVVYFVKDREHQRVCAALQCYTQCLLLYMCKNWTKFMVCYLRDKIVL